jgi:hypothetical protein
MRVKAAQLVPGFLLVAAATAGAQGTYQLSPTSEVTKYMSPRCSAMRDSLTPAATRGLPSESVWERQKAYARECGKDESQASTRIYREQAEKSQQQRADLLEDRKEQELAAMREQQCVESRRILLAKRTRTDLTQGEKDDLARFETRYRARCVPGVIAR